MPSPYLDPPAGRKRAPWRLVIAVLGCNLWATLLLLPAIYLGQRGLPPTTLVLTAVPLGALAAGAALRSETLLLGIYPASLILPLLFSPQLVGVNVYSAWTFILVAVSLLAYLVATPALLRAGSPPPHPSVDLRPLPPAAPEAVWRRRRRIYRWLAALALFFPAVLLYALLLDPAVQEDLRLHYPGGNLAASLLFTALAFALWLGVFGAYFVSPLRAHARGDRQLRRELDYLWQRTTSGRPRPIFYGSVAAAVGLMLLLYLLRG